MQSKRQLSSGETFLTYTYLKIKQIYFIEKLEYTKLLAVITNLETPLKNT